MDEENKEVSLLAQLRQTHSEVSRLQAELAEATRVRREVMEALISRNTKQSVIAREIGVSPSRISRLLSSAPKIERALLGTGPVTVAIGGKWEAQKANPDAVISAKAHAAYDLIRNMCVDFDLEVTDEVVPPPGIVHLNRDNLIVLCSPRLLPIVGQVLDADEHLGFANSAQGWYLVDRDKGTEYRTSENAEMAHDYGYIGRLPRPDGRGTFLYLAGIHGMGTLGAAHYLVHNVYELYKEVKTHRWSTLVRCDYDQDTQEIQSTERISPIHIVRH
jgi:hypothetical protein